MPYRSGVPTGFEEPDGSGPWFGYLKQGKKRQAVRIWPTTQDGDENPVLDETLEAQGNGDSIILDGYVKLYKNKPQFYATDVLEDEPDEDEEGEEEEEAPKSKRSKTSSRKSSKKTGAASGQQFVGREPGTADHQTAARIALSWAAQEERLNGRGAYHLTADGSFGGFTSATLGLARAVLIEGDAIAGLHQKGTLTAEVEEGASEPNKKRKTVNKAEKAVKEAFFEEDEEEDGSE